jgi:hypothetical protein
VWTDRRTAQELAGDCTVNTEFRLRVTRNGTSGPYPNHYGLKIRLYHGKIPPSLIGGTSSRDWCNPGECWLGRWVLGRIEGRLVLCLNGLLISGSGWKSWFH